MDKSRARSSGDQSGDTSQGGSTSGGSMAEQGTEIIGQAQDQAKKLVDMAGEQAASQFTTQQQRLAATLTTVATALHNASREMGNQDETTIADFVDTAANQVEHLAGILREQDVNQLIYATGQFARRRPALFLGAAFVLGFAATRFLRSSLQSSAQVSSRDYGTISYGSYGSGSGYVGTMSDLDYGEIVDYGAGVSFQDPPGKEDVPPGPRPDRR